MPYLNLLIFSLDNCLLVGHNTHMFDTRIIMQHLRYYKLLEVMNTSLNFTFDLHLSHTLSLGSVSIKLNPQIATRQKFKLKNDEDIN